MSLLRQVDGEEIDIAAYVLPPRDWRAGVAMDGRLYVDRRAARRELAVALLLDVSASRTAGCLRTSGLSTSKGCCAIVCEALDALGDGYALFAFSGEGPDHVRVVTLKGFTEPSTLLVDVASRVWKLTATPARSDASARDKPSVVSRPHPVFCCSYPMEAERRRFI